MARTSDGRCGYQETSILTKEIRAGRTKKLRENKSLRVNWQGRCAQVALGSQVHAGAGGFAAVGPVFPADVSGGALAAVTAGGTGSEHSDNVASASARAPSNGPGART